MGVRTQGAHLAPKVTGRQNEKVFGQEDDVVGTLAQRRNHQTHDIEAIAQLGTQDAPRRQVAQVTVGRRDEAEMRLGRRRRQQTNQAVLRGGRQVTDFFDEHRALGELRQRIDRLGRRGGPVQHHQRCTAPAAVLVHLSRQSGLAGADLTGNQHRYIGGRDTRQAGSQRLHLRGDARQVAFRRLGAAHGQRRRRCVLVVRARVHVSPPALRRRALQVRAPSTMSRKR